MVYAYQVATMMKTFYEKSGNNVVVAVAERDTADSDFLKMLPLNTKKESETVEQQKNRESKTLSVPELTPSRNDKQ